jgi:hypothetical protein
MRMLQGETVGKERFDRGKTRAMAFGCGNTIKEVSAILGSGMATPQRLKLLGVGTGPLLLLALVMIVVGYLLAPHFYLTRATFWGESDNRDLEKILARTIYNALPVYRFDKLPADNPYGSSNRAFSTHFALHIAARVTPQALLIPLFGQFRKCIRRRSPSPETDVHQFG